MTPASPYSAAFLKAVALVLRHEGGFTEDPNDDGNWTGGEEGVGALKGTNMGISAKAYPNEDIRGMTVDRATALYHRDYWIPIKGEELPPALGILTFDMAVNAGPRAAIELLQAAIDVAVDGKLGPITLSKAKAARDTVRAARRFTTERILRYSIMKRWSVFKRNWTDRSLETLLIAIGGGG